jgi:two-component system sensor kinase FixL
LARNQDCRSTEVEFVDVRTERRSLIQSGKMRGYVLACAFSITGVAVRWLLDPLLGREAPFLLFVLPVVAAVIGGGRGPGLLAGALSLLAGFGFVPRDEWASTATLAQAGAFIVVCAGIGWLGERLALERSSAERAQQAAEAEAENARMAGEQLRLLLQAATRYAIILVDAEGNISTWNRGAKRLFGWSGRDVVGRHSSIFYPADGKERERAESDLRRAASEGVVAEEGWQVRADGSEFLADITITPVLDEQRKLRGYAKVVHDATDRRASEIALAHRERQLESILATVPDAMVVIDTSGAILSFSATAEKLFGYSEADVLGKNVSMLMPSPDRERHDSYIERYLETGVPRIIGIGRVVTGLRADGTTFPMKLSVGEAQVDEERIFTGFVQDLTETRNFEARLEQLRSELIHVSRLSAMGTMASTLAHELNQPLTAIATYGEAASGLFEHPEELDRETLKEVVSEMAEQALRAGSIVRRLREFVARGEVNKTIEDLPKLINEASALALVGSREKGIESRIVIDPEATPVLADRVQIQQVLINLMRNALEAMAGSDKRQLTVETRLLPSDIVQVSVKDTGPGISPEMADRLFQAFSSTKDSGMGLGLSICRTIVEAHGGRIAARPARGGGTEFFFTLPKATRLE